LKIYERHIAILEVLLKKLKDRENQMISDFQDLNKLFELKMHHHDMIAIHQDVIDQIQLILDLEELAGSKEGYESKNLGYRSKEFWRSQVDYIFKDKPLRSKDIIDSYNINPVERRFCMSILSNVLSEICEKGLLNKFKVEGKKGFYYALPHVTIKKAD
jgi:hypothetical protein